jgi:hypothetical protein
MKGHQKLKNRNMIITTALLALGFFALCPTPEAFGVVPAPDGGYPGRNTAEGQNALFSLTTGVYNTANGYAALYGNTTGIRNTANGYQALHRNTFGVGNTATGFDALYGNTTGQANTATGDGALYYNTTGGSNTANGVAALYYNTTGSNNIALGGDAGDYVTTANNVICIGTDGNNVSNSCYIGHIFGATSSGGTAVFINSNGRLGTATSSRRFKEDIKLMDQASAALFALKPVTFRYKKQVDPEGTSAMQFGLVAEDVEKVTPDLVVRDKEGKPYSVRYEQVNAMLLNEFLKEHKRIEQQQATIAGLQLTVDRQEAISAREQKGLEAVTARLDEQAAQIRRVSAQVKVTKASPRLVSNSR